MSNLTEERVAYGLGLLGGVLFLLGALVAFAVSTVDLLSGRTLGALGAGSETLLLGVFGALAIFFAYLGHSPWRDRPAAAGLLLIVIAFLAATVIGLLPNVLALIGAVLTALSGVLLLVEPMRRAAHVVVTA